MSTLGMFTLLFFGTLIAVAYFFYARLRDKARVAEAIDRLADLCLRQREHYLAKGAYSESFKELSFVGPGIDWFLSGPSWASFDMEAYAGEFRVELACLPRRGGYRVMLAAKGSAKLGAGPPHSVEVIETKNEGLFEAVSEANSRLSDLDPGETA